jgi:hypothetical protein
MTEQLKAAIVRGLIIALPTGVLTTLTTWSQTDDAKTLAIAGTSSFLGTLLLRSGVEGSYDTWRHVKGEVHPSDVGAPQEPSPATRPFG